MPYSSTSVPFVAFAPSLVFDAGAILSQVAFTITGPIHKAPSGIASRPPLNSTLLNFAIVAAVDDVLNLVSNMAFMSSLVLGTSSGAPIGNVPQWLKAFP
ncbi:hypothetical protein Efla_002516 [Eimeria flavescens]